MSSPDEPRLLDPDEAIESQLDKKEKKRIKKLQKTLEQARRPLDAWERYRALSDAFDMEQDLVDLADNKARFALLIMGTLNAVTFIVGTRPEALALVPLSMRSGVSIYIGVYALLALYFFIQAIESLRPREAKPNVRYPGAAGLQDFPMGVRFFADVLQRDVAAYRAVWRSIHIGQLNAEVAMQVHALARINKAKYGALERLYQGLRGMTFLTACFMTVIATLALRGASEASPLRNQKDKKAAAAKVLNPSAPAQILGEPTRLGKGGALEPSGVAFDAASGHLFLVGDEGSLVEVSLEGKPLWNKVGLGNLEDVAVHSPSGNLVLLSEKKSQLVLFDPVRKTQIRKFKIDKAAILGKESSADPNEGFEGIGFQEDAKEPGGGLFYLAHQRSPAMLVAIAFDLGNHEKTIGADAVRGRYKFEGFKDLTAVSYIRELDRLLVIADHKDRLLVVKTDGKLEDEIVLPGLQQEGIALDSAGNLWIADDQGGLLRFDGALRVLLDHRNRHRTTPDQEERQ